MTETKLKPCPFCGCDKFWVSEWKDFHIKRCAQCGTEVGSLWNKRPIEDVKNKEIRELRNALIAIEYETPALGGRKKDMRNALLQIDRICRNVLEDKE